MKEKKLLSVMKNLLCWGLLLIIFSCTENESPSYIFPEDARTLPFKVLKTYEIDNSNDVEVRNGGYGSGATADPLHENEFYALTDRGPNVDFLDGKKFPVADYSPRIGHFRLNGDGNIELLQEILLRNPQGNPITGLPNPDGKGATGEIPYDNDGNLLAFDEYGIDSEGIVAMSDGTFWISDEYGPHIVHFDAEGKQLERISPVNVNTGMRKIPAVFERRRPNRGMEGLTITPDEKTLVGIMQSTMYNPSKNDVENKTVTRIVTFDLATGNTKQYLYRQDKNYNSNSEITALSNTTFLVVERDGDYFGLNPQCEKRIYKIDISEASDVSGEFNNMDGLLINGKTIEQSSWKELNDAGIKPVKKTLVVDLAKQISYVHDKLEGLWLIGKNKIGVLNDDDFAVTDENEDGIIEQKLLPGTEKIDISTLYILDLPEEIYK